jgi:multimeric flavodoxin WrbA
MCREFADAMKKAGGKTELVVLPDLGIKGNSHMLMQDKNNGDIAEVIQKWLADKGLVD